MLLYAHLQHVRAEALSMPAKIMDCHDRSLRQQRHSLVNDIIYRALIRANISTLKETSGLLPDSELRPNGATVIPWVRGKCLTWDATTPDTLAASHLSATRSTAGAAAVHATAHKNDKYTVLGSQRTISYSSLWKSLAHGILTGYNSSKN